MQGSQDYFGVRCARTQRGGVKLHSVWRRGVDTHSYCSGHMLMRVTGLQENRGKDGGGELRYHTTLNNNQTLQVEGGGERNLVSNSSVAEFNHRMEHIEWSQKYTVNAATLVRHGCKYLLIKKNGGWNIEGWQHLKGQESVKNRVDYSVSLTH